MDAKIKAVELRKKFYDKIFDIDNGFSFTLDSKRSEAAKQCALVAVREFIEELRSLEINYNLDFSADLLPYYKGVETEIEAL